MKPTRAAFAQARHISGHLEVTDGPWFTDPPSVDWEPADQRLGWALAPGPEIDLSLEELIMRLDRRVQDTVSEYRRQALVGVFAGGAVSLGLALAVALLGVPALAVAIPAVFIPIAWLSVRSRGADVALWRHRLALRWYLFEIGSKLRSMTQADRAVHAESWAEQVPFALAWIEGNWSARELVQS